MFVSRSLYDALQARYDALLEKYHALRLANYAPRPVEQQQVTPPPASDAELVTQAHKALAIDTMAKDLVARERLSPEVALAEAQRAIDSLFAPLDYQ